MYLPFKIQPDDRLPAPIIQPLVGIQHRKTFADTCPYKGVKEPEGEAQGVDFRAPFHEIYKSSGLKDGVQVPTPLLTAARRRLGFLRLVSVFLYLPHEPLTQREGKDGFWGTTQAQMRPRHRVPLLDDHRQRTGRHTLPPPYGSR